MADPKKMAADIVGSLPPPDKLGKAEGEEGMDSEAMAGSDFADAVKSGDGAAIASAFKALMEYCR